MADMTLSERIARTIELDAELRSLWPSNNVTSGIHGWSHMDVHEGALLLLMAYYSDPDGSWQVSGPLAQQFFSTQVYARADYDCSTCRALIEEAKKVQAANVGR